MRAFLAIAVAALVWASTAAAATKPPLPRSWPVVQLDRGKAKGGVLSCTAHARARVGRAKHRLLPVACEQPPRSRLAGTGFFFRLLP